MIRLEKVMHHYDDEVVLRNIDFYVPTGQLFGLLGPSGSGKTTLVQIMIGLLNPAKGAAFIDQQKVPSLEVMKEIGYMAQSDALYNDLTAWQNLDFFAKVYKIPGKKRKERIREVSSMVQLKSQLNKPLEHFSGGMKRRMSLAVALLHRPKLLILDEPTVGIDPVLRASIWQDLQELQKQGTTIVVTTHVMGEAEKCDRLAMLRDGYVIAQESPEMLVKSSKTNSLEEAFLYYGDGEHTAKNGE